MSTNGLDEYWVPEPGALAAGRRAAGLTQADVAAELGIAPNKVSRLELSRASTHGS